MELSGTATDPDGDTLTYSWTHDQPDLGISLAGSDTLSPSFTAPNVGADTAVTFTLRVTDRHNATASDTATITITDSANSPPTADAGSDRAVQEGQAVTLNGTAADADPEDTLAHSWTHDSTLDIQMAGADTLSPSFTAPQVSSNTTVTFTLMVTDQYNATATDTVAVTITGTSPRTSRRPPRSSCRRRPAPAPTRPSMKGHR